MTEGEGTPYTADTSVSDVMADPAFGGFGRLLFPVDAGYMQGSALGVIRLTWYSAIDPSETAAELNRLREDALSGRQVFFPIYSEQEMSEDPRKRDTGLSHGFGLGTGTQAEGWIEEAVRFWQEAIEAQEENR